jgi:DNA-binding PadR family transcriptional regulator
MGRAPRNLSPQTFHILLSLRDGPRHGYAIIADVRARTDGEIALTASTLYDALARMLDSRLISEVDPPATETSSDGRRRYYGIAVAGRRALADEVDRLERLLDMARAKDLRPIGRKRAR